MTVELDRALKFLDKFSDKKDVQNFQMPGDGRYQPESLKKYLGYDQWARWLIIVEWYWLETLAELKVIPEEDAKDLQEDRLVQLLININTTDQDHIEKETKHDIIALLELMRRHLPTNLSKWLHYCATSYDIIDTAYALQMKVCFEKVFKPQLVKVDLLWRDTIKQTAEILQAGRTHLQTALPVTVGFWLAGLHNRFDSTASEAEILVSRVPGKFSGAVGTSASQRALIESEEGEVILMRKLGLVRAKISTQVAPPEARARFYHELVLLSAVLANLGEDVRILQSSQFGEVGSASSTSSAMSHKEANPIAAEQLAGMHVSVIAEYTKVLLTLVTDLQRDLRASNVMRSYSAVMVYTYQQLLTTERLFNSITVNSKRCQENFDVQGKLVVAELLHLTLQKLGVPDAHKFVNEQVVPIAKSKAIGLQEAVGSLVSDEGPITEGLFSLLKANPAWIMLSAPHMYTGDAQKIAKKEALNELY